MRHRFIGPDPANRAMRHRFIGPDPQIPDRPPAHRSGWIPKGFYLKRRITLLPGR